MTPLRVAQRLDLPCSLALVVVAAGCGNAPSDPPVALVAGDSHSCALFGSGDVRCWGLGVYGQLGYGDRENIGDDEPVSDAGVVALPGRATSLAAGGHHTCAVLDEGSLYCWGSNLRGQLGHGHTQNIGDDELPTEAGPVPLDFPVAEVTAGYWHTCALGRAGNVRCWGQNYPRATLGLGMDPLLAVGDDELPTLDTEVGDGVIQIQAGDQHTCVTYQTQEVRCWGPALGGLIGQPYYGDELGNPVEPRPEPVGDDELPIESEPLQLGGPVRRLLGRARCAELEDSRIRCWGPRRPYALFGPQPNSYVPLVVELETQGPVRALAQGVGHLCVSDADGEVTCHGDDTRGQIGVGRGNLAALEGRDWSIFWDPISTHGHVRLPAPAVDLALGSRHSCALLEDSSVTCWGFNIYGQLGRGDTRSIGDDEWPEGAVRFTAAR